MTGKSSSIQNTLNALGIPSGRMRTILARAMLAEDVLTLTDVSDKPDTFWFRGVPGLGEKTAAAIYQGLVALYLRPPRSEQGQTDLTPDRILPALIRPGMYTGPQGSRSPEQWRADAVAALFRPGPSVDMEAGQKVVTRRFITFTQVDTPPHLKTKRWQVTAKDSAVVIGIIQWRTGWRCYVFEPSYPTVYEHVCLRDIAAFIEARTKEHRS